MVFGTATTLAVMFVCLFQYFKERLSCRFLNANIVYIVYTLQKKIYLFSKNSYFFLQVADFQHFSKLNIICKIYIIAKSTLQNGVFLEREKRPCLDKF